MPPGRKRPGRPRRGEDPAPSRKRTVAIPVEVDDQVQAQAQARGLSYQAVIREALAQWVEREHEKGP